MSIAAAMNTAQSGLSAASRGAEIVSSNVANAATPGYGVRTLEVASAQLGPGGGGVQVVDVKRTVDQALLNDRRISDAAAAGSGAQADFYSSLQDVIGIPGSAGSLGSRISDFQSALIAAAANPQANAPRAAVLDSANALARTMNAISNQVQTARQAADTAIGQQVGQVNDALQKVVDLNAKIGAATSAGRDASGLMDQRQAVIDKIAAIVPLREVPRPAGKIALVTAGGAVLVDGVAAKLGFSPTHTITPDMTLASGGLSGLTLNGEAMNTGPGGRLFAGGELAANFAIRDTLAPQTQAQIDGVARDLVERFADSGVDPTLASGSAGLFTDAGAALDPANEAGLAGRLSVNSAVDPARGGALWRLRDGLGAAAPGAAGDASILSAMSDALTAPRVAASGGLSTSAQGFAGLSGDFLSSVGTARESARTEAGYTSAKADALRNSEMQAGVDTNQQMQILMQVEQSFTANAKVMQTLDTLLKTLMGI